MLLLLFHSKINQMNKIINKLKCSLIVAVLSLWSCQTLQQTDNLENTSARLPSSKGANYIVTVHGYRGNKETFGSLDKLLLNHLKEIRPDKEFIYMNMIYPTLKGENVFDFSYKYLSEFLNKEIPILEENDQITLIGYSQGGLVINLWKIAAQFNFIKKDYQNKIVFGDKKYAEKVNFVITLGTPFWGTNAGEAGYNSKFFSKTTQNELKNLSYNSESSLLLRDWAMTQQSQIQMDKTRYLNIAAVLPASNKDYLYNKGSQDNQLEYLFSRFKVTLYDSILKNYSYSSEKVGSYRNKNFESDQVVNIPTSRPQFIGSEQKLNCEKNKINYNEHKLYSLFNNNNFKITEATHSKSISKFARSLVSFPENCTDFLSCKDPSYYYILKEISNCKNENCNEASKNKFFQEYENLNQIKLAQDNFLNHENMLQGFILDFVIEYPNNFDYSEKYYKGKEFTESVQTYKNMNGESITELVQTKIPTLFRKLKSKKILKDILQLSLEDIDPFIKDTFEIRLMRKPVFKSGVVNRSKLENSYLDENTFYYHIIGFLKLKSTAFLNDSIIKNKILKIMENGFNLPLKIVVNDQYTNEFQDNIIINSRVRPGMSSFIKIDAKDLSDCSRL